MKVSEKYDTHLEGLLEWIKGSKNLLVQKVISRNIGESCNKDIRKVYFKMFRGWSNK